MGEPGLAGRVVQFAGFLKGRGFRVFHTSVHNALRALEEISLENKDDFFLSLRASLAMTDLEWMQFKPLFDQFWGQAGNDQAPVGDVASAERMVDIPDDPEEMLPDRPSSASAQADASDDREYLEGIAYSPVSLVEKKDLRRFDPGDIQMAHLALKRMMAPF